jgi:BirA family biotin operon repressor/biotin-[acetyl-CoA-carboxylase] ligase
VIYGDVITDPTFPPLLRGEKVSKDVEPFIKAVSASMMGCDPGTVFYAEDQESLRAAITLAPESALKDSGAVVHALMLSLADGLGALGPPELAVHFVWPCQLKVNAARCGELRFKASTTDPDTVPDWLVVGLTVPFVRPESIEPGSDPSQTWLYEEGCIELTVPQLIESWSRHSLVWLNSFEDKGYEAIQDHWRAKCDSIGSEVTYPGEGTFVGTDGHGSLLLKHDGMTSIHHLIDEMAP